MKALKLKVCGLKYDDNIEQITNCHVDYIGLIFYGKSKRFVENKLKTQSIKNLKRVGVFVNATVDYICENILKYNLDVVQLHGQEKADEVIKLRSEILKLSTYKFIEIWKALSIQNKSDFKNAENYEHIIDKFLLDTKGKHPGGNGYHFNWKLLKEYTFSPPFFLSGGISIRDIESIQKINHSKLFGIDINSQFETQAGLKDPELVNKFNKIIKNHEEEKTI